MLEEAFTALMLWEHRLYMDFSNKTIYFQSQRPEWHSMQPWLNLQALLPCLETATFSHQVRKRRRNTRTFSGLLPLHCSDWPSLTVTVPEIDSPGLYTTLFLSNVISNCWSLPMFAPDPQRAWLTDWRSPVRTTNNTHIYGSAATPTCKWRHGTSLRWDQVYGK